MSRPVIITIPKVLSIAPSTSDMSSVSGGNSSNSDDPLDEFLVRGKKRRLDHLSWEEKVQRKKLKNRVAAQTSRDRKKARMEDMEQKMDYLTNVNTDLNEKYMKLLAQKEQTDKRNAELEQRVSELTKRLQAYETKNSNNMAVATTPTLIGSGSHGLPSTNSNIGLGGVVNGSAAEYDTARVNITVSQCTNQQQQQQQSGNSISDISRCPVENNCTLPTLQDLLEEFDPRHLEELAESLLANVTTDLEESVNGSGNSATENYGTTERMSKSLVGSKTEFMESGQSGSVVGGHQTLPVLSIIPAPTECLVDNSKITIAGHTTGGAATAVVEDPDDEDTAENTFYGKYDHATNSITIIMSDGDENHKNSDAEVVTAADDEDDDDENVLFNRVIEEDDGTSSINEELTVTTTTTTSSNQQHQLNLLSPLPHYSSPGYSSSSSSPYHHPYNQPMKSPMSVSTLPASDCGYESLGSPMEADDLTNDFWNSTMSDLFPTLA